MSHVHSCVFLGRGFAFESVSHVNFALNVPFFTIVWLKNVVTFVSVKERNAGNFLDDLDFPVTLSNKISVQPHNSLCIHLLDKEINGKNNTLPSWGVRLRFITKELSQITTATATRTWQKKRANGQDNSSARAFLTLHHIF